MGNDASISSFGIGSTLSYMHQFRKAGLELLLEALWGQSWPTSFWHLGDPLRSRLGGGQSYLNINMIAIQEVVLASLTNPFEVLAISLNISSFTDMGSSVAQG